MIGRARLRVWFMILAHVLALAAFVAAPTPAIAAGKVVLVELDGAIGIATTRHLAQAFARAKAENANAVLIRLDTPGGLVSTTRELAREFLSSPVPVIVYVAPGGARAASAGTFLVYASHLAAMAPGTDLGAATPVSLGMPGSQPNSDKKSEPTAMEKKAVNDTVAWLRSMAQLRGRDIDFAEKAVREAATLTAEEARAQKVVELVARDITELLAQADGRKVTVAGGERTLTTKDATLITVERDWRTRLLAVIGDPNIAYILLLIGIYGLFFEFWNPGMVVPGVAGGISLVLALVALTALPVQYGALALLLLGIALMVAEAFTPGVGALGIGGLAAFVVGSIYLFEPENVDLALSIPIVIGAALACALLTALVVGAAMRARERPPQAGSEQMIGMRATVVDWNGERGNVRVQGELWSARGKAGLTPGDSVRVVQRDGLTLTVEPE